MFRIVNINDKYGDAIEFRGATIDEAVAAMQTTIRACGPEFAEVEIEPEDYEQRPVVIEVCESVEALREYCGLDFSSVEDGREDDAAEDFRSRLHVALEDAGYETKRASGQRSLCHGWNGANTFRIKRGPCGTFANLSTNEIEEITAIIDRTEAETVAAWQSGDETE